MKVKDLIAALQQHDPEHMVVVDGYEGGVDEVTVARKDRVELNRNRRGIASTMSDYFGAHELSDEGQTPVVYVGVRSKQGRED